QEPRIARIPSDKVKLGKQKETPKALTHSLPLIRSSVCPSMSLESPRLHSRAGEGSEGRPESGLFGNHLCFPRYLLLGRSRAVKECLAVANLVSRQYVWHVSRATWHSPD